MMLVFDDSSTTASSDWAKFMGFCQALIDALPIRANAMHAGLVEFGATARLASSISTNKTVLKTAVRRFQQGPGFTTYMAPALAAALGALGAGSSDGVCRSVVVLGYGIARDMQVDAHICTHF